MQQNLKVDLSALRGESFETTPKARGRLGGTVFGLNDPSHDRPVPAYRRDNNVLCAVRGKTPWTRRSTLAFAQALRTRAPRVVPLPVALLFVAARIVERHFVE